MISQISFAVRLSDTAATGFDSLEGLACSFARTALDSLADGLSPACEDPQPDKDKANSKNTVIISGNRRKRMILILPVSLLQFVDTENIIQHCLSSYNLNIHK